MILLLLSISLTAVSDTAVNIADFAFTSGVNA